MSDQTELFLKKCVENQKAINENTGYTSPTITALDVEDLVDSRGGSATTSTTTGAAVALGVSAVF